MGEQPNPWDRLQPQDATSRHRVLILLKVWQFGSSMLIFLAALKEIPQDLYESSSLDGASRVTQFFKITIPLIQSHRLLQSPFRHLRSQQNESFDQALLRHHYR